MKNIRILLATFLLTILSVWSFAQSVTPVKWAYKTVKVNDSVAELQFTANIEPNWHLYAQKPGQGQIELPLVFNFTKSPKYERMGKVAEPTPQSEYDDIMDAHSNFYTKQVTFKQRVKVKDDQPFTVQGKLEGQACIEGRCTPIEEKFSFDLKDFHPVVAAVTEDNPEPEETDNEVTEADAQTAQIAPAAEAVRLVAISKSAYPWSPRLQSMSLAAICFVCPNLIFQTYLGSVGSGVLICSFR